ARDNDPEVYNHVMKARKASQRKKDIDNTIAEGDVLHLKNDLDTSKMKLMVRELLKKHPEVSEAEFNEEFDQRLEISRRLNHLVGLIKQLIISGDFETKKGGIREQVINLQNSNQDEF